MYNLRKVMRKSTGTVQNCTMQYSIVKNRENVNKKQYIHVQNNKVK